MARPSKPPARAPSPALAQKRQERRVAAIEAKQASAAAQQAARATERDPANLEAIPVTYQAVNNYFAKMGEVNPFLLRNETITRIERITGRPLLSYVARTHNVPQGVLTGIEDGDLVGFADLLHGIDGTDVDVLVVSNGGSAEATERIVRLLRDRFDGLRFIVPANAFSAATLLCFAGDEILMGNQSTLGPIDPQINGIPARAILRAIESLEERLKEEGPRALTAYMPLLSKYDLHILEICKSSQSLSKELAESWLSDYMLMCDRSDPAIEMIVSFFSDYDIQHSHGRSIDRTQAASLGLKVTNIEAIQGLADLVTSLYNQYEIFFNMSGFFKLFENAHGISWGRQMQAVAIQVVPPGSQPAPQMPPQA